MPKGFRRSQHPELYQTPSEPVVQAEIPVVDETVEVPDLSSITLKIEEADDTVPPLKKSIKDHAKAFAAKVLQESEESDAPAPKRGRSPKGKFWQNKAPLFISGALGLLSWAVPAMSEPFQIGEEVRTLAPTQKQAGDIITPLLRILDRHTKVDGISPDVADACESIMAMTVYGFELRANLLLMKMLKEQEHVENKARNGANSVTRETSPSNGNYESNGTEQALTW